MLLFILLSLIGKQTDLKEAFIYHFTRSAYWHDITEGQYEAPSLVTEGFIHCSKKEQIIPSATKHAQGLNDLILLEIKPNALDVPLKYENTSGGTEEFPHIYGAIPAKAVNRILKFPLNNEGQFELPDNL